MLAVLARGATDRPTRDLCRDKEPTATTTIVRTTTRIRRGDNAQAEGLSGPAIFPRGFRLFYFFGAIYAGATALVWLPVSAGDLSLPTAFALRGASYVRRARREEWR